MTSTTHHSTAGLAPVRLQFARLGQRFAAAGLWLWRALEASGQRRAQRSLMRMSRYWSDFDPELAAKLRDAAAHDARA